eukprot:GILK01002705.1.p1 GENE.GILK01002705.1~~GILK01002705.1.p1  ORF type:complete len:385 (+),score=31.91 GILK01002705.1:109-1155(+)
MAYRELPKNYSYRLWVKQNQESHSKRMKSIKPSIDNKPPKEYSHLTANGKKALLKNLRNRDIQRENNVLLQKLFQLLKEGKERKGDQPFQLRTLNYTWRKRELERINQDNKTILKSLQEIQPMYNHVEWKEHAKQVQTYLESIQEYKDGKPKPGPVIRSPTSGPRYRRASHTGVPPIRLSDLGIELGAVPESLEESADNFTSRTAPVSRNTFHDGDSMAVPSRSASRSSTGRTQVHRRAQTARGIGKRPFDVNQGVSPLTASIAEAADPLLSLTAQESYDPDFEPESPLGGSELPDIEARPSSAMATYYRQHHTQHSEIPPRPSSSLGKVPHRPRSDRGPTRPVRKAA